MLMDNPETLEAWQEWFDQTFPKGVNALRVDGLQMLVPFIRAAELLEGDEVVIAFFAMHLDTKILSVTVTGVEQQSEKEWSIKTDSGQKDWSFSTNFSDEIGDEMLAYRKRQEELREKYKD